MQPSQSKRKGYCEIAISPFDHAQLVHARGDGRSSQSHVVMLPSPAGNPNWIRQTASVRLSSGCAVIVAPEEISGVPLMHMLQWRPCGDARTDLALTQFVSASSGESSSELQRHTIIRSTHPIVACAFIENQANPLSGHQLIMVTASAIVSLDCTARRPGSFYDFNVAETISLPDAPGLTDCIPMLFTSGPEWKLAFFEISGTVHLFDRSSSSILVCALPPPSPPPQPSSNWMGNLFAVLPFNRPAPPSSPQPAVADTKVLDAVSKFSILSQEPRLHVHLTADQIALPLNSHTYACTFISLGGRTVWMTVFAKSDFSFTCTVNDRNTTIDVHLVPQPDGYLGDMPPPDSRPDSACITCTTDGDKVVCAAAWVMHIGQNYKTYVRSFFVYEDPEQRGCLSSQEVFYERPKSSLHAVTCLSIQCGDDGAKNRLCLVGSSPPAQSPASQEARNCSQKHVTAVEIIVMRKFGTPGIRSATCMLVHGLSNQMRDDINFLQSDLSKVLEQRAKTVSGSGALHSAGGSGSLSRIFAQYLQQSQWWQYFPSRMEKALSSLKRLGDDWVTQSTQVIIRPEARPPIHQSKKLRGVGSDDEKDIHEHTYSEILKCVEQLFEESMCTPTRTTKSTGRVFPCDDLPYACLPYKRVVYGKPHQPLLSSSFFIVKSAYVCAIVDNFQDTCGIVPPVLDRVQCITDHSEFQIYPKNILNYAAGPSPAASALPLPEILRLVSTMSYFYSTRHNFIKALECKNDKSLQSMENSVCKNERLYGLLRQLASVVIRTEQSEYSALSVLDCAWHVCTRSQADKNHDLLVVLSCFKLLSPFFSSPESSVENIPTETLRACQLLVQFHDLNHASAHTNPPSLLSMVRLVLAVRNADADSARKFAGHLLQPSNADSPVDPFRCYDHVKRVFLASKLTSELCDVLTALLQTCASAPRDIPKIIKDAISACLDCARFLGAGGAVQLANQLLSPEDSDAVCERIIYRAVILRRVDVLRQSEIGSKRVLNFFKKTLFDEKHFCQLWVDSGADGDQNREALVRAATERCLHPEHKDFPEFRYVAAACSLKLAHAKFKSRNWSAALYHADTALNCVKLLRHQVRSVDFHEQFRDYVQKYKLLPALPPRSKELPPGWIDASDLKCHRSNESIFERYDIVLGSERISEADLNLFCALLRALSFVDADETNRKKIEDMMSGQFASLSGLHVFSRKFYKELTSFDEGRYIFLRNAPRWSSGIPGCIQVSQPNHSRPKLQPQLNPLVYDFQRSNPYQILETAFELMVAYCKVPHGQACDPQINTVNRPGFLVEHSSKELPEHFVRTCVQIINSALKNDPSVAYKFDCFAWLSQIIARLEVALECTPPLMVSSPPPRPSGALRDHRSVGFFHEKLRHRAREIVWLNHVAQVAVSKMAELGIVPPYEFVADGMGRNASVELCYENNNVGNMAWIILKISPEMAELILARFLEWVLKRMGVTNAKCHEVVFPDAATVGGERASAANSITLGRLLLVPVASFQVLGLNGTDQQIHVPESTIELLLPTGNSGRPKRSSKQTTSTQRVKLRSSIPRHPNLYLQSLLAITLIQVSHHSRSFFKLIRRVYKLVSYMAQLHLAKWIDLMENNKNEDDFRRAVEQKFTPGTLDSSPYVDESNVPHGRYIEGIVHYLKNCKVSSRVKSAGGSS